MIVNVEVEVVDQYDETDADIQKADLLGTVLSEVADEYLAACDYFPNFKSPHEGLAIIEEEFEEFKSATFWPHKTEGTDSATEVKQLAAMCIRYLTDITYADPK